jgi:hypothetical protein
MLWATKRPAAAACAAATRLRVPLAAHPIVAGGVRLACVEPFGQVGELVHHRARFRRYRRYSAVRQEHAEGGKRVREPAFRPPADTSPVRATIVAHRAAVSRSATDRETSTAGRLGFVGRMSGEGEEDVVERGLVHLDVVNADRRGIQRTHDGRRDARGESVAD